MSQIRAQAPVLDSLLAGINICLKNNKYQALFFEYNPNVPVLFYPLSKKPTNPKHRQIMPTMTTPIGK